MTDRDTSKLLPVPEPEPADHWCHVCGTRVRSYGSNRHPCPFGPHDEDDVPHEPLGPEWIEIGFLTDDHPSAPSEESE